MEDQDKVVNAKEFKKNKKLKKDKAVNDIIGKLSLLHKKADDGLKELVEMCHCNEEKDGR